MRTLLLIMITTSA